MAKKALTELQVIAEIERLKDSEFVKLAKREEAIRYRNRQRLYSLRCLEKKGRELAASGITMDMLSSMYDAGEYGFGEE